jgi:putative transposase
MSNLKHNRTCVFNLGYYIVWSTKYRRQVLVDDIEVSLKNILNEIAKDKGFSIKEIEIMPDQVHVFVESNPKIAPTYIYKMLKGISARKLLIKHQEIKKNLWNNNLWNPSTYIESVGNISRESIIKYIDNQKTK